MPLTDEGQKVMASMVKKYGPEKGESVFYATINKGKPGSEKWHEKGGRRKANSNPGMRPAS